MNDLAVARELAGVLRSSDGAPGDPACGWPALLDIAATHKLLPATWSALRARGVRPLPAPMRAPDAPLVVLEDAYLANEQRVTDLRAQTLRVLDTLGAEGIDAIPIKGAHWILTDRLPDPAARVAVDVDVSVPRVLADDAFDALRAVGYRPAPVVKGGAPAEHQLPALLHPAFPRTSVEVHVKPFRGERDALLTAEELHDGADEVIVHGLPRRVPNPEHELVLLVGHAQLQEDGVRLLELPLRALYDLAVLHAHHSAAPDIWRSVAARFGRAGHESFVGLAGFLTAARDLFGVEVANPTPAGDTWWRAVSWTTDHPTAAALYRTAMSVPRALDARRMRDLYDAESRGDLARARMRHVTTGVVRRLTTSTTNGA